MNPINAENAVVWVNRETREIRVQKFDLDDQTFGLEWSNPIGADYAQWHLMNDQQRVLLMLETAIDLATQGSDLGDVLRAFADVSEFRALCRALAFAIQRDEV
jgi:hypothetical protein